MNFTAEQYQIKLITATGSGVGFRHFKLPNVVIDAIIDGLNDHISAKSRETLEDQVKKACGQKIEYSGTSKKRKRFEFVPKTI